MRKGYVYLLRYELDDELFYKIGCSKDVEKRVKNLRASKYPKLKSISIEHSIEFLDKFDAEDFFHNYFARLRKDRGEFFDLSAEDVEWFKSLGKEDLFDLMYNFY